MSASTTINTMCTTMLTRNGGADFIADSVMSACGSSVVGAGITSVVARAGSGAADAVIGRGEGFTAVAGTGASGAAARDARAPDDELPGSGGCGGTSFLPLVGAGGGWWTGGRKPGGKRSAEEGGAGGGVMPEDLGWRCGSALLMPSLAANQDLPAS